MRLIAKRVTSGLALALVVAALPAVAAEGRVPIWQPISILPGMEGKYIVTRDVSAQPGMPVIDIQPGTVAVNIDLNGFTLYGLDTDIIRATGIDSLTIRNGTIMFGQGNGIAATDCRKVVIEDVRIQFVQQFAMHLRTVANFAVRRNIIVASEDIPMFGILVDGAAAPDPVEGVIAGNQIERTQMGIEVINGSSVAIQDNRVQETFGDGIRGNICNGCLIAENTVESSVQGFGIAVDESFVCKIYNNVVTRVAGEGIALLAGTSDCLVIENNSSWNNGNGLVTDGQRNFIDRNVFNQNQMAGIWFLPAAAGNTFGRNTIRGNLAVPGPCAFNPPGCIAPDVCADGFGNTSFNDNMGPNPGC